MLFSYGNVCIYYPQNNILSVGIECCLCISHIVFMIIRYRTTKAPKGQQTIGRGETPVKVVCGISPKRAAEGSATPLGFGSAPCVYRGFTPAYGLNSPSGFVGGTFADNHIVFSAHLLFCFVFSANDGMLFSSIKV